jgi:chitin disaccharide deacetylase
MERKVVINADDFGLSEGVNRAVLKAHKEGVLTSATLMAAMPAAQEAIEIAKQNSSLGVGVHLNLTEGKPLIAGSCLAGSDEGFAYSPGKLSLKSLLSKSVRKSIEAELEAQINWVIERGVTPTHLDSHKHVHCFPMIFSIVCRLAQRFGIGAIRWPNEAVTVTKTPWPIPSEGGREKSQTVRMMAKINAFQNKRFFKTQAFFGVAHTGKIDENFLKAVTLYNTAQTAEIMTHPGYADGLDPSKTKLLKQREAELEALCSEKAKKYFKDEKIELITYGQI